MSCNVCTGATGSDLSGCGKRLCRNMRPLLVRMSVMRPEYDEYGQIVQGSILQQGTVCAYISRGKSGSRQDSCDIPGRLGAQEQNMRITVAASSFELKTGDVVQREEEAFRVTAQLGERPVLYGIEPCAPFE